VSRLRSSNPSAEWMTILISFLQTMAIGVTFCKKKCQQTCSARRIRRSELDRAGGSSAEIGSTHKRVDAGPKCGFQNRLERGEFLVPSLHSFFESFLWHRIRLRRCDHVKGGKCSEGDDSCRHRYLMVHNSLGERQAVSLREQVVEVFSIGNPSCSFSETPFTPCPKYTTQEIRLAYPI
jgi:hypothetical protein